MFVLTASISLRELNKLADELKPDSVHIKKNGDIIFSYTLAAI
jgi:hypothetical protein